MDASRLDMFLRSLAPSPSRRRVLRLLAGSPGAGLLLLNSVAMDAKKRGKGKGKGKNKQRKTVTLCHNGQTIPVSKSAAKAHQKHGDTPGACPPPAPPSPPAPPEPVTVTCPGPLESTLTGSRRFAQTFTAPASGQLTTAQVELGNSVATHDYTVEIRSVDPTGTPTATVLASARIEDPGAASSDQPLPLTATLNPPAAVQAGTPYAVVLTADAGQGFALSIRNGDDCPGQFFADQMAANNFTLRNNEDMVFSITIVE